ncbi:hypothetical protein [Streptomyces flavofungini]|uniref:hypothetical protein n=1 Tax=Streptomyces flavofungini TaxID=68200 RepID=UPI0025B22531|nr:hypothetical protein [Streptomyces flavofungini]WJV48674.1 hypothetical protein QUY26_26080 [Streptomyces flavofungini]
MTVAHEESYDAVDALTLAVTDTPVPEGVRADERFMAEHAAAVADVAVLREQLRIVGETLARGPGTPGTPGTPGETLARGPGETRARPAALPSSGPPPAAPFREPGAARRRAVLALAAALAAGMLGGLVWLGANAGTGDGDMAGGDGAKHAAPHLSEGPESAPDASKAPDEAQDDSHGSGDSRSREGYVACARLIVEGTVRRVDALPGGTQDRITLDVSRYHKPAEGEPRITFVMDVDVEPRLRAGDRVLIGIPKGEAMPDLWTTGERIAEDRAWIEKALPGARGTKC